MEKISNFSENLFDSYLIKVSEERVERLDSKFQQRGKKRIPYLFEKSLMFTPGTVLAEKLDGALTNVYIRNSGDSGAQSHRISKRTDLPIEHTGKIPSIKKTTIPKSLGRDEMDLKGEFVVIEDRTGKILPHQEISAILNSTPSNAMERMLERKLSPKIGLFDIWDDDRPYNQKIHTLRRVVENNPDTFFLPRMAITREEKLKLVRDIKSGKNPRTIEGIVWNSSKKWKFTNQADVYIHSFFDPLKGSKYDGNAVGGINYALKPGEAIIGKVGTGFSDALRRDMYENSRKYIGKKVMIEHQGQYEATKAFRAPALKKVY